MGEPTVFGRPVTDGNHFNRALEAYNNRNVDAKRDQALAYVRTQKENYGNGSSTLCIFYNATGEDLIYKRDHSEYGKIYDNYPLVVKNGQWGAFLHVKTAMVASGSVGYVLYENNLQGGESCNVLLGWETPSDQITQNNHAYCDIYNNGTSDSDSEIYRKMEASGRQHIVKKGLVIMTTIEEASSPLYKAILTTEDVIDATI